MTKREKLIERLLSKPKDFAWGELIKVLNGFGYRQISVGKTGGSRARFIHSYYPPIILHKPHPKPILKRYQIEEIINLLKQEKLI
ncbi:MAG TPA: type II toxin-antitoxin system HicA family toxin [Gammaproteobacteria bacterium]|nr:type II toxin-antitoxin system HicA family toxin [Gammaproteobacteria bacterium]